MTTLIIAILIATGLVAVAVYRERKSINRKEAEKRYQESHKKKPEEMTEYEKHLARGGKDYRHMHMD